MVAGVQASENSGSSEGPRPVNLRSDLGQLADLIEISFANAMDNRGRAAVQEMRTLARMGPGLSLLSALNQMGMGQGHVWVANGRIVGNVTVYPASERGFDGKTWVFVNVATHPNFQRRGIAEHLMHASMEMIRTHGARTAYLQVDADNMVARRLYNRLGFVEERGFITWRRSGLYHKPAPNNSGIHIAHRRADEWRAEYELAQIVRPQLLGGLGWLRPLAVTEFRRTPWQQVRDWLSFRSVERLVIRSDDGKRILAALWVENMLMNSSTSLTLLVHPDYEGVYDEALLNTAVRRFGSAPLSIEHPADREATSTILRRYQFGPRMDVIQMRWDVNAALV
jgi:ribosomal protein S18 acetylase RimI-like enzyme